MPAIVGTSHWVGMIVDEEEEPKQTVLTKCRSFSSQKHYGYYGLFNFKICTCMVN